MLAVTIIGCVVGVVGCVIGVATFASAQITKAKNDGMLISKVEQCLKNTEEIKKDVKEKNKEYDILLDEHSRDIVELQTKVRTLFSEMKELKQA